MKPEMAKAAGLPKNCALALLTLAVMCFAFAVPVQAAEKAAGDKGHPAAWRPAGEDVVQGILDRSKPSENDNASVLVPLTGTWDYLVSVEADPTGKPEKTTGMVVNEMVLGNRFLSSKFSGDLVIGQQTLPMEGQELLGYDSARKAFTSVWADTLTTGMMMGSGKFDEKTRVLTENGRFTNPLTGKVEDFRSELHLGDGSSYTLSVFVTGKNGKETKFLQIDYSRR